MGKGIVETNLICFQEARLNLWMESTGRRNSNNVSLPVGRECEKRVKLNIPDQLIRFSQTNFVVFRFTLQHFLLLPSCRGLKIILGASSIDNGWKHGALIDIGIEF
jgi:hypothetical protein